MSLRLANVKNFYSEKLAGVPGSSIGVRWQFIITMDYLPELSVNRYKHYGTAFTKPEVKRWMEDLSWMLSWMGKERNIDWHDYQLKIIVDGKFKDNRVPDLHNFLKVICDSVEDATLVNDKLYSTECGVPELGEPCLTVTILAEVLK